VRELFQLDGVRRREGEGNNNNRTDKGWKRNNGEKMEGVKTRTVYRKERKKWLPLVKFDV
jgi:hypothetical protein